MKTCCAKSCTNNSTDENKKIVTFHKFPQDLDLKNKWIHSLDLRDFDIDEHSEVCSVHFKKGIDLLESEEGVLVLKDGAIPKIRYSNAHLRSPAVLRTCRVCLAMDETLYHIADYDLYLWYEQISGLTLEPDDQLPKMLCWECVGRLRSAISFREKAIKTHTVLSTKTFSGEYISVEHIKQIDRNEIKVNSTLTHKHFKTNDCDLLIIEAEAFKGEDLEEVENKGSSSISIDEEMDFKSEETQELWSDNFNDEEEREEYIEVLDEEFEAIVHDKKKALSKLNLGFKKGRVLSVCTNEEVNKVSLVNNLRESDLTFVDNDVETNDTEIVYDGGNEIVYDDDNEVVYDKSHEIEYDENIWNDDMSDFVQKSENDLEYSRQELELDAEDSDKISTDDEWRIDEKKKSVANKNNDRSVSNATRNTVTMDLSLFTVTPLTVEEEIAEIESRKQSEIYQQARFKCTVCYLTHKSQVTSELHAMRHSEKHGAYECFICKKRFPTSSKCNRHLTMSHTTKYACNKCSYVTKSRSTAKDHQMFHAGQTFQCPYCPRKSSKITTHLSHLRVDHPTSAHACDVCGLNFVSQKGVDKHKSARHKDDEVNSPNGPYCDACNIKFMSSEAYGTHLLVSLRHCKDDDPNRIRNDTVSKNGRVVTVRGTSRRRLEPWTTKDITCEVCGVELLGSRAYISHFRVHHPLMKRRQQITPAAVCELCGKAFRCRFLLMEHMFKHRGEKPFKCKLCEKKFNNRTSLYVHKRMHEGPAYQCPYCDKKITYNNSKRHILTVHKNERRFRCDICMKSLTSRESLNQHISHVHNGEPWPKRTRAARPRPRPTSEV